MYQHWAKLYDENVLIMLSDFRDVFFQSNPFSYKISDWVGVPSFDINIMMSFPLALSIFIYINSECHDHLKSLPLQIFIYLFIYLFTHSFIFFMLLTGPSELPAGNVPRSRTEQDAIPMSFQFRLDSQLLWRRGLSHGRSRYS